MTLALSGALGGGLPVHRCESRRAAAAAMDEYVRSLQSLAAGRRSRGLSVSDQDHPDEVFHLVPPAPSGPPLVLIGGMGPLAGVFAFRRACAKFGDSRSILLHQACAVPDRTRTILADNGARLTAADHEMAAHLARAVGTALDLLPRAVAPVDCIMACNSAHYFWEALVHRLALMPEVAKRLNLISMVDCSVQALCVRKCRRILVLCTLGARLGQVFSRALRAAGLRFFEPEPERERWLMSAIYDGLKAMDERRALMFGTRFFAGARREMGSFDCILAGCTELPPIIDMLKERGGPEVRALLSRIAVVDPIEAALDTVAVDRRTGGRVLATRGGPAMSPRRCRTRQGPGAWRRGHGAAMPHA